MNSINIIISAAKSRLRVKCKQSCTSSFRISYFEGRKHMSMLSAIILAILLLASCSKNASESSFHDAREALDAQKVFLSRMKSDKDCLHFTLDRLFAADMIIFILSISDFVWNLQCEFTTIYRVFIQTKSNFMFYSHSYFIAWYEMIIYPRKCSTSIFN